MKILNICAYTWAIGGPARIIYDHTIEVLKQGHEVTILSPMTPGEKMYPAPEGAELVAVERTTPISNFYREFSIPLYHYLKKHIQEFDVIHMHGIWHFGSLAPFLIHSKAAKVITIHGLLDSWAVKHSQWKKEIVTVLYQKRLLGKADLIQINNLDEQADVQRYLGYKPKNLKIIPNGMKIEEYQNLPQKGTFRAKNNIDTDTPVILFMGRLNIKKGLDLLLPAFAKIQDKLKNAVLILAGPDDGYQKQAEQFIIEHGLTNRIKMVGMLTDTLKKEALADADLFVLPSYSEGFSIAALEAMICGVPSLVSDRVGFGEYIKEHHAAYVTKLEVSDVANGILQILGNPDYAKTISKNAKNMVINNFDIRIVANQLLEEYKKVNKM